MSVTVCKVSVTAIILLTSLTLNTSKPLIRLSSCCDIILHTLHNYDKLFYNQFFFSVFIYMMIQFIMSYSLTHYG